MATELATMNWRDYVGRFSVEFEVANHKDVMLAEEGFLPQEQVRRSLQMVKESTFLPKRS